ncbi:MAG: hypothetical protein INR71_12600, partial [Terriglobus roseus]|nr:hypothetical protein [Terriglobus roseus]
PDDIKGKSEPAFSIDRALKKRDPGDDAGTAAIEMQDRRGHRATLSDSAPRRTSSLGRQVGDGFRRRIGSLRRSKKD